MKKKCTALEHGCCLACSYSKRRLTLHTRGQLSMATRSKLWACVRLRICSAHRSRARACTLPSEVPRKVAREHRSAGAKKGDGKRNVTFHRITLGLWSPRATWRCASAAKMHPRRFLFPSLRRRRQTRSDKLNRGRSGCKRR